MLYLLRLFVYHAAAEEGSDLSETLKIMERRLLRIIVNPAMIAALVFGGLMFWLNPALFQQGWMHVKITGIFGMIVLHHLYARWRKVFARDENARPPGFYRLWNEAPMVLIVVIVLMAVAKPF